MAEHTANTIDGKRFVAKGRATITCVGVHGGACVGGKDESTLLCSIIVRSGYKNPGKAKSGSVQFWKGMIQRLQMNQKQTGLKQGHKLTRMRIPFFKVINLEFLHPLYPSEPSEVREVPRSYRVGRAQRFCPTLPTYLHAKMSDDLLPCGGPYCLSIVRTNNNAGCLVCTWCHGRYYCVSGHF